MMVMRRGTVKGHHQRCWEVECVSGVNGREIHDCLSDEIF